MDVQAWNILFKAGMVAIVSFFIPFILATIPVVTSNSEVGFETTKKEWIVIFLISFLIMIFSLLLFGINITNK